MRKNQSKDDGGAVLNKQRSSWNLPSAPGSYTHTTQTHREMGGPGLPTSTVEWLRAPGAGSLHDLACSPAPGDETASRPRHATHIGLLTGTSQGASCVDCGQHHMFCSCSGYQRDTRLSAALDPRSPRSSLSGSANAADARSLRSLLAEQAAAELRNFELAASEQMDRIAQERKAAVAARNSGPAASQRPRRVSFDDKVHEQPMLEASQVAHMMMSARQRSRRQSMPALTIDDALKIAASSYESQPRAAMRPDMAEIVENYFENSPDDSSESSDEQRQLHQAKHPAGQERAHTKPQMVKSRSLVFEDAEADALMGRSPPTC